MLTYCYGKMTVRHNKSTLTNQMSFLISRKINTFTIGVYLNSKTKVMYD